MNSNLRKEQFSLAYIRAVAAAADCHVIIPEVDVDSVDGQIRGPLGIRHRLDFQAKSTTDAKIDQTVVRYELERKDYDDLRQPDSPLHILILMMLPPSEDDWVSQTEAELCLRKCAYWLDLRGEPDKDNRRSVTVRIPRKQVFDPVQLPNLLDGVHARDPI